jgi:hypothetical protein
MSDQGGWYFWVDDKGRVRLFMVAEADMAAAQSLLLVKYPYVQIISFQAVPASVFKMMKIARGQIVEWVCLDPKDELTPQGTPAQAA